jgi:SP family galactose:H+ symporter-like MFS transporter
LFFVLASEQFPPTVRSEGLSLSNALAWLFNIAIVFSFPVIKGVLGSAATFGGLAAISAACVMLIASYVQDAKPADL